MLNSMWGKFGQRMGETHVEEFTDPRDLHAFLASGRYVAWFYLYITFLSWLLLSYNLFFQKLMESLLPL